MGPYFGHETLLENQLTVGNVVAYPKWFKVVFYQISIVVTIEILTLTTSHFAFLNINSHY